MACIRPLTIRNPRFLPNDKNGGIPPIPEDKRLQYIQVPCGKCVECMRKRATDWRMRMLQEFKYANHRRFHFITLTFDRAKLQQLREWTDTYDDDHVVVKFAVRRFLERYRWFYKVSLRHLFISEIGEDDEHIHIHGIIIDCKCGKWHRGKYYADYAKLRDIWEYGHIWLGWCEERSISYILKYMCKVDPKRPEYRPLLLVSPGMGKAYCEDPGILMWHSSYKHGIFYMSTTSGHKVGLPRYYRLKLFSEDFLRERQIRLLDDPPPLYYRGEKFDNLEDYTIFVKEVLDRSVRMGLTLPPVTNVIDCNRGFYNDIM